MTMLRIHMTIYSNVNVGKETLALFLLKSQLHSVIVRGPSIFGQTFKSALRRLVFSHEKVKEKRELETGNLDV